MAYLACSAPVELVKLSPLWSLSEWSLHWKGESHKVEDCLCSCGLSNQLLHGIIVDRAPKCHLCFMSRHDICQSTGGQLTSPVTAGFPASLISFGLSNSRHFAILG